MKQHIESRGGTVKTISPVKEIVTNADGTVKHLLMRSGETIVADEYVSAMPVDIMKRFVPKAWSTMPYFEQMKELEGIPVINIHMWFDRKLKMSIIYVSQDHHYCQYTQICLLLAKNIMMRKNQC